jgi:LCP family protein required for cell wall assembly
MPEPPDEAPPNSPPRRTRTPRPPAPASAPSTTGAPPANDDNAIEPRYTRYRTGRRLAPRRAIGARKSADAALAPRAPSRGKSPAQDPALPSRPRARHIEEEPPRRLRRWRRWIGPRRLVAILLALSVGWVALSLVLFLVSAQFERTSLPGDVNGVLDPAGFTLTSANNILVLGSDARQKASKEPGANISGPSRSDTIMLIRTGGGHAARLSIPRDTVVNIPGHGAQKINAAYAFGGPALSIAVIKSYLGLPINHLVEVNFEDFPQLIDAMGGVNYTGGCIVSRLDGGFRNGGYTLRLSKGTHHLNGKQALALARTRENLCAPQETDLQREAHQQALFQDMKSRLLSPSSFLRLPWISWNAPPAIISDMSGPTLLGLFGALASSSTPPTRILKPSGAVTLSDGESGLQVSSAERRAASARFEAG